MSEIDIVMLKDDLRAIGAEYDAGTLALEYIEQLEGMVINGLARESKLIEQLETPPSHADGT